MSSSPTSTVVDVTMPQMGVSVAEGTIVEWKKAVGEWVDADETLVEISTDKVETEIPSPASGTLTEILVEPGQTVDVGVVLARIGGAEVAGGGSQVAEPVAAAEPAVPAAAPVVTNGQSRPRNGGPPISPVVRRMADEHQIDLSLVSGSGRLGRVTKRDLLAYLEQRSEAPALPTLHSESPYIEESSPRPATRDLRPRGQHSSYPSCAAKSASTWCARCRPPRSARRWSRPT